MALRARKSAELVRLLSRTLIAGAEESSQTRAAADEVKPFLARLVTHSRTALSDCLETAQPRCAPSARKAPAPHHSIVQQHRPTSPLLPWRCNAVAPSLRSAAGERTSLRPLSVKAGELARDAADGGETGASESHSTSSRAEGHERVDQKQGATAESSDERRRSEQSTSERNGSERAGEDTSERAGFRGAWDKYSSWFQGTGGDSDRSASFQQRLQKVSKIVWREVQDAVLPRKEILSPTRAREGTVSVTEALKDRPSDLVVSQRKTSGFWKLLERFQDNPFFRRLHGLKDHEVIAKGREFAEDLKGRWETSDHPMMHKIQDVQDRLFSEPEAAQVMRRIRIRDNTFDMVRFLRSVKDDVPIIITAYLEGKEAVLQQHCTEEMTERLIGMYKHYEAQGSRQDPTLLFVSDVELFDATFVENEPIIVVTFSCQQINCLRDKFGNVVDGREDEIHQVYYAWALQQDEHGAFDADGHLLPPRWQLREMMIRGFHNLL